jgi:hypothetical protein
LAVPRRAEPGAAAINTNTIAIQVTGAAMGDIETTDDLAPILPADPVTIGEKIRAARQKSGEHNFNPAGSRIDRNCPAIRRDMQGSEETVHKANASH